MSETDTYDIQALKGAAEFFENMATGVVPEPLAFAQAIRRAIPELAPASHESGLGDAERICILIGPRVDGQVIVAAIDDQGEYDDNPEWLWRNHDTGTAGFGRWSKESGQAPYIRADIVIDAFRSIMARISASKIKHDQQMRDLLAVLTDAESEIEQLRSAGTESEAQS